MIHSDPGPQTWTFTFPTVLVPHSPREPISDNCKCIVVGTDVRVGNIMQHMTGDKVVPLKVCKLDHGSETCKLVGAYCMPLTPTVNATDPVDEGISIGVQGPSPPSRLAQPIEAKTV